MKIRIFFSIVVIVLALAIQHSVLAAERSATFNKYLFLGQSSEERFLYPIRRPVRLTEPRDPVFERICAEAESSLKFLSCPLKLTDQVTRKSFLPPPVIAADLPHLRLAILIDRIEHQAVSGGGIGQDSADQFDDFAMFWDVESEAATEAHPDEFVFLPVNLNAGEVWNPGVGQPIFSGTVANGCSSETVIDVKLTSFVQRELIGNIAEVQLQDMVVGNGSYVVSYTIRATEGTGAVSDFIFGGYANAYCTAQI